MRRSFLNRSNIFALSALLSLSLTGCQIKTKGVVRQDTSRTGQTDKVGEAGINYNGPQYTIGILTLANKTPSKVLGIGEAATDILRTMLKDAGLEPIMLTDDDLTQQSMVNDLQANGYLNKRNKNTENVIDAIDYRVSGAITSYSELEEGTDILIAQSKSKIVRVGVDYALVDVSTGRTLVAKSGEGEYSKRTGGLLGFGSKSSADAGLKDGALRDAMAKAVESMITELSKRPFQGSVLVVEKDSLIFRGGTRSKLKTGVKLGVFRNGGQLVDPNTGHVLGVNQTKIGEIELSSHQSENVSEGNIISSSSPFRAGDIVKLIQ